MENGIATNAERKTGGPGAAYLLEVENVTVRFGGFTAVRSASFGLASGNLLGLIGPNGAGKTTLLRAIASLQPRVGGTVRVMGRGVKPGDEEAARMIGFTPDVPPAYEAMNVRQYLNFIAAGYGLMPENTGPTVDFLREKVWLTDKAKQKVKGLSRGMRQRLGLARTLLANPQIILLDEPAAGLDPAGRVQFRKLLTDLRDQGKSLIVSSHILSDMEEYCTHAAIMSHGTVIRFGTVREIAHGEDTGRCGYVVELAEPVTQAAEVFGGIAGVTDVQAERLSVTLEYDSARERGAELLRTLVQRGVPVAGILSGKSGGTGTGVSQGGHPAGGLKGNGRA